MVLSPGIAIDAPFVNAVREAGVPIWGEVELAYVVGKGKLAAITGTNGKTTTTALVGEILAAYYEDVDVVGNIGTQLRLQRLAVSNWKQYIHLNRMSVLY